MADAPPDAGVLDDISGVDLSGIDLSGIPITPLSATDALWQSLGMIGGYIGIILYVAVALRFVAFVTSDALHKPLPYRILLGVYTFLFAPLFIAYYSYRTFKAAWDIRKPVPVDTLPVAYSIFPAYEFDAREPYDLIKSIAGYPNRKDVLDSIQARRAADDAARLSYLKETAVAASASASVAAATGSSMVNSTLMTLLSSAGIVAVGFVVCVILFTLYQLLVPAAPSEPAPAAEPPTCTPPPPPPPRPLWWPDTVKWPPLAPPLWSPNTPWPTPPPEGWPKGKHWPTLPPEGWPSDISWPPLAGSARPPTWPSGIEWPPARPSADVWPEAVEWPLTLPTPSTFGGLSSIFGGSSS